MKKLITMVALAAISFGSAYAGTRIEKMQTDTTKKSSKADTTKKKPPVVKPNK